MRRGNKKVCICAWLIIGVVEYLQAVDCEEGKFKGLYIDVFEYRRG